ncbi:protein unzipped [Drosophila gunungcola]|uniref:protein unzipped n=1 Tax=Drosophila gunungcola TaxID=103775 RepID=UPI0022E7FF82|nr:protein unzipped [Drosophila gunungcola]XP_052843679.1 protein unzipped [Drosophila gunungcola]XP_052843681.1 protein unzipped [Drosophila gunungcola]XP_052843682.1 protein unzipped [Drosophila gunungcola]XP_052843683.1 protein unzipped [Drosophila gunungcola]XP_052843684.1 protein unzipped [Drosophila gunungcola]XP_052843685.1 protein unzipped [Drosophila gunungcola]
MRVQPQRSTISRMTSSSSLISLSCLLVLIQALVPAKAAVHSVFTHKNASSVLGQLVTSSTLVWESYDSKDVTQLQFAVEGGKYVTEDEHYPIYVCRVPIDGFQVSGHTEKILQRHVCVAAHYKHGKYDNFDVLMNKGHLGKVGWRHWRKFDAGVPVGAIRIGDDSYIGRHRAPIQPNQEGIITHWGADFNLGHLEPVGLGKIRVIENEREKYYDDGEVLVETEPFRYELKDIKLDRLRTDIKENLTELVTRKLENLEDKYSTVETILSYSFDYNQYWGSHEGVARGLPTKIFEKDMAAPAEINWALKHTEKRTENKAVHTKLWPGTAINVTLRGNYVTLEAPYSGKLFAFYYGSEESVSRKISAEVRKSYLKDVKLEFSPVYWIENGTLVPTTTTTTTTSTSTTTHATTTSTNEPTPINEPPLVHMKDKGVQHSGPDTLEKTLQDSPSSNEVNSHEAPENMSSNPGKDVDVALAGFGINAAGSIATAGSAFLTLLVTVFLSL